MSTLVANPKVDAAMSGDVRKLPAAHCHLPATLLGEVGPEGAMKMNANLQDTGMISVLSRQSHQDRFVNPKSGAGLSVPLFLRWPRIRELLIDLLSAFPQPHP